MIDKIKAFFAKNVVDSEDSSLSGEQLATAALLIEVMVIDGNLGEDELQAISATLSQMLEISATQVDELILLSRDEVAEATSLYQFTREINAHFEHDKKLDLMTAMWRVAFADGISTNMKKGLFAGWPTCCTCATASIFSVN